MILMRTTFGDISLELDSERAPISSANFIAYARDGFYNGTIFHRVISDFMIQGGGFEVGMNQKPTGNSIENEADNGLKNELGTVAMARTMDPHSATAQFFINVKDNDFLNYTAATAQGWGYAVFGRVVDGMNVIEKIKAAATGSTGGQQDVPLEDIIIESVELIDED